MENEAAILNIIYIAAVFVIWEICYDILVDKLF